MHPKAMEIANMAVSFSINPSLDVAGFRQAVADHAHDIAADIDAAIRAERLRVIDEAAKVVCPSCWSGDADFVVWHSQERGCRYMHVLKLKESFQ